MSKKVVKGFKAMKEDFTCGGFKFKVGKTYKTDSISIGSSGFHFCENVYDVYNYYEKSSKTVVCKVEAMGEVQKENDQSVTNKIKIIRQLTDKELVDIWINRKNSGYQNGGFTNTGDRNSGHWNSGDWNSGNRNGGDGNSGDWNSGDENSGDGNSGDRNSGNGNSGYGNSGDRNSGDWNSGDGNSGYFNTKIPLYLFNKPSEMKYSKELENKIRSLNVKPILQWVASGLMTEEEKNENPSHKTTGGFLRKTTRYNWKNLTEKDIKFIKSLPNFDNEIFKIISNGVDLENFRKNKSCSKRSR